MDSKTPLIVSMLVLWITRKPSMANSKVGVPSCSVHETLTCGYDDLRYMNPWSWYFCKPKTRTYRNITSVDIDLRYQHSYCHHYENPVNFGVTEDRQEMWVFNMCSGTFRLCLDIETLVTTVGQPVDTATVNATGPNIDQDTETTYVMPENTTTSQSNTTAFVSQVTETGVAQGEEELVNVTDNISTNNHENDGWPDTAISAAELPNSIPDNPDLLSVPPDEAADDGLSKVWMTMGMVIGVFVLVCLVVTIFFLALHSGNTDEKPLTSHHRSRTENVSTAMLMKQDSEEARPSVYDFIPINAFTQLPDLGERCTELPDLPVFTTEFQQDESQYMELPNVERTSEEFSNGQVRFSIYECDMEQTCFIADDLKQTNDKCRVWTVDEHTECSNDEKCANLDADGTSVHLYYRLYPENEYDHLMSMPRSPMADQSTYNRLYQVNRNDNSGICDKNDNSDICDKNDNSDMCDKNDNSDICNKNDNSDMCDKNDNSDICDKNDNSADICDKNDNSDICDKNDNLDICDKNANSGICVVEAVAQRASD